MENEEKVPLYLKVEELAPHAKEAHVRAHFGVVTKRVPIVYVPKEKDAKVNKGFAFVYVSSIAELRACLALDHDHILNKRARVLPGLYPGGRGMGKQCAA
ncbi:hypothetical protein Tco_1496047 [Tanacetum coccineum]